MRTLQVRVKPASRRTSFEQQADGVWLACIQAPPVDGKANAALIDLVASHFKLRKAQVTIKHGAGGRLKLVQLDD